MPWPARLNPNVAGAHEHSKGWAFLEVGPQLAADLVNDILTSRLHHFEHTAVVELRCDQVASGYQPLQAPGPPSARGRRSAMERSHRAGHLGGAHSGAARRGKSAPRTGQVTLLPGAD